MAVVMILSLAGWRQFFAENVQTVLRLQGSNTIGARLAPALVERFLKSKGASRVRLKKGKDGESLTIIGSMGKNGEWAVEIDSRGTGTAFEGLQKGVCDIGMASRPIKNEEAELTAELGDLTRYGSENVIGMDGLAVIVNAANPLKSASRETIAAIFSGETASWKEMGGSNGAIRLFARDDRSGTYDTFKSLVLQQKKLSSSAARYSDSRRLSDDVASEPNGIGFIGLPYINSGKPIAISVNAGNSIYPTPFTVASEEYPLSRRLYMYLPPKSRNRLAHEFVEFVLSDDGQETVERAGFVSLAVKSEVPALSSQAPPDFRGMVQGAERLSVSFRFRPETISFDNRARRDMERLVHALEGKAMQWRKVMLFGFSDSGEPEKAMQVSEQWVRLVAGELVSHGIRPAVVKGMGSAMPLSEAGSGDGALRSNRVEIWLAPR